MRKIQIIILLLSIVSISACGRGGKVANQNDTMKSIHLTKADFLTKVADLQSISKEWKYLGDKPAIIDFYASWCGPCRQIAPILEELAAEYGDKIYVYKIDVDAEPKLAGAFNVRSIPTILFVPMTGAPQTMQGAAPKKTFVDNIENILLKK